MVQPRQVAYSVSIQKLGTGTRLVTTFLLDRARERPLSIRSPLYQLDFTSVKTDVTTVITSVCVNLSSGALAGDIRLAECSWGWIDPALLLKRGGFPAQGCEPQERGIPLRHRLAQCGSRRDQMTRCGHLVYSKEDGAFTGRGFDPSQRFPARPQGLARDTEATGTGR